MFDIYIFVVFTLRIIEENMFLHLLQSLKKSILFIENIEVGESKKQVQVEVHQSLVLRKYMLIR